MMERMESLSDTGLCLQDLVSGVATSSSATSGSSESSAAHNHLQHTNHHHVVPVSAVSVSSAAAGIMSAGSAVLGLNHHHHVSAAVHDSVGHHHVSCAPTVLHHEPLEKLKRGEYFAPTVQHHLQVVQDTTRLTVTLLDTTHRPVFHVKTRRFGD